MKTLLEEYYRYDLSTPFFIKRKAVVPHHSCVLEGVSLSGKSTLLKHYLLEHKKSTYLYLDTRDRRIDWDALNTLLEPFCREHHIRHLAIDPYDARLRLFPMDQWIFTSERPTGLDMERLLLHPLDFEEFLAFEPRLDASALNHFFQLGGFAIMHRLSPAERLGYLQRRLEAVLHPIEMIILEHTSKLMTQKLSPFALYERIRIEQKISKDTLYRSFKELLEKRYLYALGKYHHPKAVQKLYVCDTALRHALSLHKHFGRLFENLIFLELVKHQQECYYEEKIDFYLPQSHQILLSLPFANEHALFKHVEVIEGFIVRHGVESVLAITMNTESTIAHPIAQVEMIPFAQWALALE